MRLVLVSLLLASTAFAEPPRRRVHIDHLDPAKVGQFEQARKDWVAWIAAITSRIHGAARSCLDAKPTGTLDPKPQKLYNDRSDAALVPPHHSEIWAREPELDHAAIEPAGFGTITYEDIELDETYEKAWGEIEKELVAAKYPVARVAFFSQYGSGKLVSLWLAPTKAAFAAAPTIDQVLTKRLGKAKADALLARRPGAVVDRQDKDLVVRADLSN
ncbi:MAG: hypothetical protein ABJE66_15880 [Deltaproteobacteria bacterium]